MRGKVVESQFSARFGRFAAIALTGVVIGLSVGVVFQQIMHRTPFAFGSNSTINRLSHVVDPISIRLKPNILLMDYESDSTQVDVVITNKSDQAISVIDVMAGCTCTQLDKRELPRVIGAGQNATLSAAIKNQVPWERAELSFLCKTSLGNTSNTTEALFLRRITCNPEKLCLRLPAGASRSVELTVEHLIEDLKMKTAPQELAVSVSSEASSELVELSELRWNKEVDESENGLVAVRRGKVSLAIKAGAPGWHEAVVELHGSLASSGRQPEQGRCHITWRTY